jgi:dihydrofolate reductase
MRKVILKMSVSIDGFVGGASGGIDWIFRTTDDEATAWTVESIREAARVVTGDLAEQVARLRQEPGKDIVAHGGATFAQSLVRLDLVDEYRLLVHPVALGSGLPLFSGLATPLQLELVDLKRFRRGTVAHVYRRQD